MKFMLISDNDPRTINLALEELVNTLKIQEEKIATIQEIKPQSAYDIAVIDGFTGTETEWIDSLKGETGATGRGQHFRKLFGGNGTLGDVRISADTTLPVGTNGVKIMEYNNLIIDAGKYFTSHSDDKVLVILVKGTLTLNGTIKMDSRGGLGGAGHAALGLGGKYGAFGGGGGGAAAGTAAGGGGGGGQSGSDGLNEDDATYPETPGGGNGGDGGGGD